jgi:hypothetical protein
VVGYAENRSADAWRRRAVSFLLSALYPAQIHAARCRSTHLPPANALSSDQDDGMNRLNSAEITERRRLGGWLPASEKEIAAFRMDLSRKARAHIEARRRRTTVVEELTALIYSDPILRMDLTRAIDDACEAGFVLGYRCIDELMDIVVRIRKKPCESMRPSRSGGEHFTTAGKGRQRNAPRRHHDGR